MSKTKIKTDESSREKILFTCLFGSYWGFYAAYLNYAATFFLGSGISSGKVSALISGYLLMSFFGAFIWGEISDHFRTNKKTLLVQSSLSMLLCILIYFLIGNRTLLSVLYPMLGFAVIPIGGNIDAWALRALKNDQAGYGKMRATGSYVNAVTALIFGWLIRRLGFVVMLLGAVLLLSLLIITSLRIAEPPYTSSEGKSRISFKDVAALFSAPEYRRMILIIFLIGMAVMPANNLKIVIIENVNGDVGNLGIDAFIGVMVQAPLIALTAGMKSISIRRKMLFAAIGQLGMLTFIALARNVWMIYIATCCTNIGYGILLPTMRQNVETYVKPGLRNLGHNVADAVYASLSGVLSTSLAGYGSERFGVRTMMAAFAIFMLVPLAMCVADVVREPRSQVP